MIIRDWLNRLFRAEWLNPPESAIARQQAIHAHVFGGAEGRELIEFWLETILLNNPRSTDPYECVKWTAQCAMVEDIIKALDRAEAPDKYQPPTVNFRKVA